jgi:orotate phosphoribosyltransferase
MQLQSDSAELIASSLLDIQAVFLRPEQMFTWSSGIKSPIYCDNRITLAYPELRKQIRDLFIEIIRHGFPNTNLIVGVATAGIPQAALLADHLDLPLAYVRSKGKDHGRANLIEGQINSGAKAIIVEDLISTGASSLNAIQALESAGVEVLALLAIFTYNLPIATQKINTPIYTLSNYDSLIKVALSRNIINTDDLASLQEWKSTVTDSGS